MNKALGLALILGAALAPAAAPASGIALRESSVAARGAGFAGATASAEDISFMVFNPAGLTRHGGTRSDLNFSTIVGRSKFAPSGATTASMVPITGGNGGGDVVDDAIVPSFYLSHQFGERLFGGISLTSPFGLATDYSPGWVGRYHALESRIFTANTNPVLAYKVTPRLSVATGVQILYARAIITNAIDFGTIGSGVGGTPTADDGYAKVKGEDVAFGYNFGLLYELSPRTRIGVAYRSHVSTRIDGNARFDLGGAVGTAVSGATGAFVGTGAAAKVDFPETVSFGIHHELTPRLSVMGEAQWTRWRRINELRVQFDNPLQADEVITTDWNNTWFFAVGAVYRPDSRWMFRAGLSYDQSPTPDARRTPRVPDEDRIWASIGVGYALAPAAKVDFGYSHLFVRDSTLQLTTADPNNTFRGNLSGRYRTSVDILGVRLNYTF